MIYLDVDDLLSIADRVIDGGAEVRDGGLLAAAVARPQARVFGEDAYASVHAKAAALMDSVVCNHALVDGDKRLGLASAIAFLGMNGWRLNMSNDAAFDLVIRIASGELGDVPEIAHALVLGSELSHPR